jgi:hypothetical protein
MTAHQLREWETFYELEPFGEDRRDQQLGRLYQLLLNVYRNTTSHPARFRLDECIPPPDGGKRTLDHRTSKEEEGQMKWL